MSPLMGQKEHNVTSGNHNEMQDMLLDNFGFSNEDDFMEDS